MANKIDQFWEIFKAVANDPTTTVIESTDAIAKSDRTKVESYFSNVIDQFTFETADYNRLRKFMIDLYASFRTQGTISLASSDPHSLTNSDLDELFRSMGYNLSSSLRGFDENPLEQKVQFFLDLVNLYKVKGTPQSLVDVLQYYGVTEVDIYEFFLKKDAPDSLFFDGNPVAGTTVNASKIGIPYNNLTATDPHWLYTAQQILQLDQINKINLPSKTPYLGVQPTVNLEGAEMAIIERYVQDQYDSWINTGILPPPDAEITYIGETRSLLELYLSCIYMFNKLFDTGFDDYLVRPTNFMCYDGTNVDDTVAIIAEYDALTKPKVISREDLRTRYNAHLDLFSRPVAQNFLIDKNTAGVVLNTIDPSLKAALDAAGAPLAVLYSLLKDLALWVRANIGFGFVNFGFILFGIQEFFKDLKPVIEFFKPYRARLLLLESLSIKSRLFNTIVIEDQMSADIDLQFHDFMTGDSEGCCAPIGDSTCITDSTICRREPTGPPIDHNWRDFWATDTEYAINDSVASGGLGFQYICIQSHTSGAETKPGIGTEWTLYWDIHSSIECTDISVPAGSYYSRDTYDCGSFYDVGAVTDKEGEHITVIDEIRDHLRCPVSDTTGFVVSEILNVEYAQLYSTPITGGVDSLTIFFNKDQQNTNYSIGLSVQFDPTVDPMEIPQQFGVLVTDKQISSFNVSLSGAPTSNNYSIDWFVADSTCTGIVDIDATSTSQLVTFATPQPDTNYSISGVMSNVVDSNPSIYGYTISDKTTSGFKVNFSGAIDSPNYKFEFSVCDGDKNGNLSITPGSSTVSHTFAFPLTHKQYPLITVLESSDTNIYAWTVVEKTALGFTVELSAPADSTNYNMSWVVPDEASPGIVNIQYYQSGGFRDFDSEGTFDCTHGFDLVQITVEDVIAYLLQETGFYLLQENGARIIL